MQYKTVEKSYFLRQSGRITGPFSLLKLTAMYRSGLLKCEDMCSEDKCKWNYINILFPDLTPAAPKIIQTPPVPADFPPDTAPAAAMASKPVSPETQVDIALPAADDEDAVSGEPMSPFKEWIFDIGRTFALLWNFQEILQKHIAKAARFYVVSLCIHLILGVVFILIFGKHYSPRFHFLFSPLMGISLLAILYGAASLIGRLAAKSGLPKQQQVPPSWKFCAAGIFMSCGTAACCFMALAHGFRLLGIQLFAAFLFSITLCCSAMQLRDYLEHFNKPWKVPVICIVLFLNPVTAAVIYCFKILV